MWLLLVTPPIALVYLIVIAIIAWKLRGRWRVGFVTIAIAAPFWEVIPKAMLFNHLCNTEQGIRVTHSIDRVDSVWLGPGYNESEKKEFLGAGYAYVEELRVDYGPPRRDVILRYTLDPQGNLNKREVATRTADYELELRFVRRRFGISQINRMIRSSSTGTEVLAHTKFQSGPGWWARLWSIGIEAQGRWCPHQEPWSELELFLRAVPPSRGHDVNKESIR